MSVETTTIQDGATTWYGSLFDKVIDGGLKYLDYETQQTAVADAANQQQNQAYATGQQYPVGGYGSMAARAQALPTWAMVLGSLVVGAVLIKAVK